MLDLKTVYGKLQLRARAAISDSKRLSAQGREAAEEEAELLLAAAGAVIDANHYQEKARKLDAIQTYVDSLPNAALVHRGDLLRLLK